MKKEKFSLTTDLVSVEPEPLPYEDALKGKSEKKTDREQLNIKISKDLKMKFQFWCLQNGETMTDILENLIAQKISDEPKVILKKKQ